MNALFMVPRLAGYMHGCIEAFADAVPNLDVTIVSQPNAPQAPFEFPDHPRICIRDRDVFTSADWLGLVNAQPAIAYLGGWSDAAYRRVGAALRHRVPVIMGMDNLWKGTVKQRFMSSVLAPWVRSFCNRIWIPGLYQYEYARRLGFPRDSILTGLYSANNGLYDGVRATPGSGHLKNLVFVGNMWQDKGVNELVEAFRNLAPRFPEWRLQLVGGGPLVDRYRGHDSRIDVMGFRQPADLPGILVGATAFCLPSYHDQWAVVIHEACCAGLPVIATDVCGAVSAFVHDGYNGFRCAARDVRSLGRALESLMSLPNDRLAKFGRRSHELSLQITRELWVSKIKGLLAPRAGSC
jgi:glycosyltransferase involved in cell wall biosynthesis